MVLHLLLISSINFTWFQIKPRNYWIEKVQQPQHINFTAQEVRNFLRKSKDSLIDYGRAGLDFFRNTRRNSIDENMWAPLAMPKFTKVIQRRAVGGDLMNELVAWCDTNINVLLREGVDSGPFRDFD